MRKAWVMKQPFEKLVERHRGGTVGRHVDVSELIERYPRLFHLAEASSAPAISEHGLLPAKEIVSILTDMTAWQWLSALNERGFFWLHLQRPDQLLNARRNRGRPRRHPRHRHRQHGQRSPPPHPAANDQLRVGAVPERPGTRNADVPDDRGLPLRGTDPQTRPRPPWLRSPCPAGYATSPAT